MAKRPSFLDRVQPNRMRTKVIAWPLPHEAEEAPRVRMRVLGAHELEQANIAMHDHFKSLKRDAKATPAAAVAREHIELVYRAFADDDGAPLAESIDDFAQAPAEIHDALYAEWERFQGEAAAAPLNQAQLDELVEGLKKKAPSEVLDVLPSIWLRQLLLTLVSPPPTSTMESVPGS